MGKLIGFDLALSLAIFLTAGCGGDRGATDNSLSPKHALVESDLADLHRLDPATFKAYDDSTNGIVTAVFGGSDNASILKYLSDRVSYYAVAEDLQVYPADLNSDHLVSAIGAASSGAVAGAHVVALNVGTQIWLNSLLRGAPGSFTIRGFVPKPVTVTSTRVGLVVLSDGYAEVVNMGNGKIGKVTRLSRQTTLMHEARHSDCSGGISNADLHNLMAAARSNDRDSAMAALHGCGHPHVICPKGHDYEGLPACDHESWGAYKVGAIFAKAAVENSPDLQRWELGQAIAIDSNSRLLVPSSGTPDMSSAGLTGN